MPVTKRFFKEGIEPLGDSGRLGALLLQFLWSLRNEPENRNYLWQLRDRFAEYPLSSVTVVGSYPNCLRR
jgi:uncharacterized protein YecE (DUF72 family)